MQKHILNNTLRIKRLTGLILTVSFFIILSGCKKLLEAEPPADFVSGENVYTTNAAATAVLNGIYLDMNEYYNSVFQGNNGISLFTGLDGDELTLYNGAFNYVYIGHYKNALSQTTTSQKVGAEQWRGLYNFTFRCNAIIEGLNKTEALTPVVKYQLLGEAKFLRAFMYFHLVNLFGDVPLPVTTDPDIMMSLRRSPKEAVYNLIESDLKEAEILLSENFLDGTLMANTNERVRPSKWAAKALLARVYLYNGKWSNAEEMADAIINNATFFGPISSTALNSVFFKNSREAIWQLQPTVVGFNTAEAQIFVLSAPTNGPNTSTNPVFLSNTLLAAFESNDLRAKPKNWIDTITVSGIKYFFPYKYKVNVSSSVTTTSGMTEYFMMLRLGEQYLIRAEARAKQGKVSGAQSDLNAIRNRAGLPNTTANDESTLLTAILKERRAELFCELGHRWFDLKRTGKIDEVMNIETPQKSAGTVIWENYRALYPIPLEDLQRSQYFIQNPGY
jgi:hypothetical protein